MDIKQYKEHQHHYTEFVMPTTTAAYAHFHGMLEEIYDYGDMCNGHTLHIWDDGGRKLCRCRACGGLVLVQSSEYHGDESNDYYTDYIPVDSAQEAEHMNEQYGGFALENEWSGKKVFVSHGHVCPNYR